MSPPPLWGRVRERGRLSCDFARGKLESLNLGLSLRIIRRRGRTARTRPTTAGRSKVTGTRHGPTSAWSSIATRASWAATAHLVERFLPGVGQDLRQPGIDVFLKLVKLRFLLGSQVESELEKRGQDLTRARRCHHRAARAAGRAEAAGAAAEARRLPGLQGGQFGLRDRAVLVGISPVEKAV